MKDPVFIKINVLSQKDLEMIEFDLPVQQFADDNQTFYYISVERFHNFLAQNVLKAGDQLQDN